MKNIFILALTLAFTAGCNAEEIPQSPIDIDIKKTKSVKCYSGNISTYENNRVILVAKILDNDISARIKEVDTGISVRVPVSQCYFRDN